VQVGRAFSLMLVLTVALFASAVRLLNRGTGIRD